ASIEIAQLEIGERGDGIGPALQGVDETRDILRQDDVIVERKEEVVAACEVQEGVHVANPTEPLWLSDYAEAVVMPREIVADCCGIVGRLIDGYEHFEVLVGLSGQRLERALNETGRIPCRQACDDPRSLRHRDRSSRQGGR